MPSGQGTGTNPLHNKKPKKASKVMDDDDKEYQDRLRKEKKERDQYAEKAKGKGPMNTGAQGIKKSGKK